MNKVMIYVSVALKQATRSVRTDLKDLITSRNNYYFSVFHTGCKQERIHRVQYKLIKEWEDSI
jgi:hypothetical protein